jgi:FkbM family methyltransferase
MSLASLKPLLVRTLGQRATASIHGLRFVWLRWRHASPEPEFALLDEALKPGDVAVDVGANGADWCCELDRRVGPSGRVFAFEADPYYAIATDRAIRLLRLRSVTLFPFGLSEREEDLPLRIRTETGERHSGLGSVDRRATMQDEATEVVTLKPLDALAESHPRLWDTALIKCDVEGFELFVFRGAVQVIERARPVVILETGRFDEQGYTAADLHEFFASRGYRAFAMTQGLRMEPTDSSLEHPGALGMNRTLVPQEKLAMIRRLTRQAP